MLDENSHISDQDLILAVDGELSKQQSSEIKLHLESCWSCRGRMRDLEGAIADFVRIYHDDLDAKFPPSHASRAELRARLSELAREQRPAVWHKLVRMLPSPARVAYAFATFVLTFVGLTLWQSNQPSLAISPNPKLTPGAVLPVTAADICRKAPPVTSRAVGATVGTRVFNEYGIRNPEPGHYEMDYLIDPDLGGSDDPSNLWPQPYSALWNARVKDALERHLRDLVCTDQISLVQAQHDISSDWIAAYKRYFHTDQPLPEHLAFEKDQPWK